MREVINIVRLSDDLDYARDGTKNDAAVTVTVGLDGAWRELDLSEAHHAELQKLIRPYLDAGRPVRAPVSRPRQPLRRSTPEQFAYMAGLREFAKENGIRYITSTNKYYYPVGLRQAYAEHLEKQGKMPVPPDWLDEGKKEAP